jgi:hypothetical protein
MSVACAKASTSPQLRHPSSLPATQGQRWLCGQTNPWPASGHEHQERQASPLQVLPCFWMKPGSLPNRDWLVQPLPRIELGPIT